MDAMLALSRRNDIQCVIGRGGVRCFHFPDGGETQEGEMLFRTALRLIHFCDLKFGKPFVVDNVIAHAQNFTAWDWRESVPESPTYFKIRLPKQHRYRKDMQ